MYNKIDRHIIAIGRCYVCGKKLQAGTICFDCNDTDLTKKELREKILENQKTLFEKKGTCNIKPEEGVDYFTEELVRVSVSGSGSAFVWDDGDLGIDSVDYTEIDWTDIDIDTTEGTGEIRKVDPNGNPFDEREWLRSKLMGVAMRPKAEQSIGIIRPLYAFPSAEQSQTQSSPQSTIE